MGLVWACWRCNTSFGDSGGPKSSRYGVGLDTGVYPVRAHNQIGPPGKAICVHRGGSAPSDWGRSSPVRDGRPEFTFRMQRIISQTAEREAAIAGLGGSARPR